MWRLFRLGCLIPRSIVSILGRKVGLAPPVRGGWVVGGVTFFPSSGSFYFSGETMFYRTRTRYLPVRR